MGGPLSALVADFYMDHLELIAASSPLFRSYSLFWARDVDDILCIWAGTETELDQFFSFLNSLRPSIDFTLEKGGYSLPFLDLTIRLVPRSSNLITKFSILLSLVYPSTPLHYTGDHTHFPLSALLSTVLSAYLWTPLTLKKKSAISKALPL